MSKEEFKYFIERCSRYLNNRKFKLLIKFMKEYIRLVLYGFLKDQTNFPLCNGTTEPCFNKGKRRRRNTAYYEDELNFTFQCSKCFKKELEYWNEMWAEYYSSIS